MTGIAPPAGNSRPRVVNTRIQPSAIILQHESEVGMNRGGTQLIREYTWCRPKAAITLARGCYSFSESVLQCSAILKMAKNSTSLFIMILCSTYSVDLSTISCWALSINDKCWCVFRGQQRV